MKKKDGVVDTPPAVHASLERWLFASVGFSIVLLLGKIIWSTRLSYGFLAWNLFLAYVPYFISNWLEYRPGLAANRVRLGIIIFCWVLFMPNSFYILTDLFHLKKSPNNHPWFDLTLILSFAWNGIIFGILSVRSMERILKKTTNRSVSFLIICAVMWLNAFGIYLGRFLRYNSWDVILNPIPLSSEIIEMIFDPFDFRYAWVMSSCFAIFMVILYYTIKNLAEAFRSS